MIQFSVYVGVVFCRVFTTNHLTRKIAYIFNWTTKTLGIKLIALLTVISRLI